MTPSQSQPGQPPTQPSQQPNNSTNALSIIALILSFIPVIGLIVAIIARRKSKDVVALIGVIIGSIFTTIFVLGIVFGIFGGTTSNLRNAAKDTERTFDTEYLGHGIEKYVTEKKSFPESLDSLSTLSNFDMEALKTPEGKSYNYDVTPTGCNKTKDCTGYRVYTTGSNGKVIEFSNSLRVQ